MLLNRPPSKSDAPVMVHRRPLQFGLGKLMLLTAGMAVVLSAYRLWGIAGALSCAVLTAMYYMAFRRRPLTGCLFLSAIISLVWSWSWCASIGMIQVAANTSLKIHRGVAEFRHIDAYNIADPIPHGKWHKRAIAEGWVAPPPPKGLAFERYTGRVLGISRSTSPRAIVPAEYSLIRIPLWIIPALLLLPWSAGLAWRRATGLIRDRVRGARGAGRKMD
jgi:hypothetical protein